MESFKEFTKTTIFKIAASLFMLFVSFIFATIVSFIQANYRPSFLLLWIAAMSAITGVSGVVGLLIAVENKGKE